MTASSLRTVAPTTHLFPVSTWNEIATAVAGAFRLTAGEHERLHASPVAKLIAAIPFLAQCDDAERTAVAHLGTYLLSVRETKRYFCATAADDTSVLERLRLISAFKGGDPAIIDRGMCLLALEMVSDYRRDAEEDVFRGKHNPISSGDWDHDEVVADLTRRIEAVESPEMDAIMSIALAPDVFWFL